MRFYFKLQYKRFYRNAKDNNSSLLIAALITLILVSLLSSLIIQRFEYGSEIVAIIPLGLVTMLNSKKHLYFLNLHFQKMEILKIRWIENLIICVPFGIILSAHLEFYFALILIAGGSLLAITPPFPGESKVIPTPFYKKPFEFIIGFRKNWAVLIGLYTVATIGLMVDNYNLALVTLFLCLLSFMRYFSEEEPQEWIWVYNKSASAFLKTKIIQSLLQSLILASPILLSLLILHPPNWPITLAALAFGLLIVILSLLVKYAFYPDVNSIVGGIYIAMSLLVPPIVLISIPYFYGIAKKNQNELLDDNR
jgi:hypothetical protein